MNKLRDWISVLFSGLCWYLSFDLTGRFWFLLWFAPIPVLLLSYRKSPKIAFVLAFIAYLIGRLAWLPYLLMVLPVPMAILSTLILPLFFALVVLASRKIVLSQQNALSVLAFPVLWSLFEFLVFEFSPDGTYGSLAYTQASFLPVVQIASVTGILGITFLVTLFPSVVSGMIYYRFRRFTVALVLMLSVVIIAVLFGWVRLMRAAPPDNWMTAGLAVLDEKVHSETDQPNPAQELQTARLYAAMVARLAGEGAQVAVLPEKIVSVTPGFGFPVKSVIANAATTNHIAIVTGYTEFIDDHLKVNKALAISGQGVLLGDYQKVHLFEGEVRSGFMPGKTTATFTLNQVPAGVAICKDLDFSGFIRQYGEGGTEVIFVPAWDFIKDGWLHSRMAILRGVENGCSIARTARQGKLTISDYLGRVVQERSSTNNKEAFFVARIPLTATATIYSRLGDWFGYLIVAAGLYYVILLFVSRRRTARR